MEAEKFLDQKLPIQKLRSGTRREMSDNIGDSTAKRVESAVYPAREANLR